MRTLVQTLAISALLITSAMAGPAECTDIDLRNEVLGKVRNQGHLGWCFVHAAADLISYRLGKRVSVAELGTTYFKMKVGTKAPHWKGEGIEESGYATWALKTALRKGVCLEEDLPTENYLLLSETPGIAASIPDALDVLWALQKGEQKTYIEFPHVSKDEVLELLSKHTLKRAWAKIVERSCENRKVRLEGYRLKNPLLPKIFKDRNFRIIDRELERENILGISYYASFLDDVSAARKGGHASVIVGRRWNQDKDTCEYLIRNSWGPSCSSYDPKLSCDQGNIWIPRDLLRKNIKSVSYLTER